MFNKIGQVNKVFVFVFSIIVILFAAFLVVKFVTAFLDDSTEVYEQKFFDLLEKNYDSVKKNYGSEKVYNYKVSNRVTFVCFVSNAQCIDSLDIINDTTYPDGKANAKTVFESGDNVILFDEAGILTSKNIGEFTVKNTGCLCLKPDFGQWFKLLMGNNRNSVVIDEIAKFD